MIKNILAVDDEPVILTALNSIIAGDKYRFIGVPSGQAALRYLANNKNNLPDLILLDIEMPEMNGYELIKIIKSDPEISNIPVIFLTGHTSNQSEVEGLSLGAVDFITKPPHSAIILKRIEIHLLIESQKQDLIDFNNNLHKMVEAQTKDIVGLKNTILQTMSKLVEYRDDITGGHIERTQAYLSIMLDALKEQNVYEHEVSSWNTELLLQSAQLHDVGKIAIRDGLLLKPGRLTEEEFEQIKSHTIVGEKIIEDIQRKAPGQTFLKYAKIFVVTHHERWDGSGYPNALKGEDIPLLGRIMAIADVYDALVSERPYKRALSHQEAVEIFLDGAAKHFDPQLIDIFIGVADKFERVATFNRLAV